MNEVVLLDHRGNQMLNEAQQAKVAMNRQVQSLRHQITKEVKARFDLAQTVEKNWRHWQNSDYL
jgi:hypothetical protein